MRRFLPWTNNLNDTAKSTEPPVKDTKIVIQKIEYKLDTRMQKEIECRSLQSQVKVTKGYTERKKKRPTDAVFGVDNNAQEIRNNVGCTIVQRDNIWHPYYEVKLEDEDLGSKMRKNMEQRRNNTAVDGVAIEEIQAKLQ